MPKPESFECNIVRFNGNDLVGMFSIEDGLADTFHVKWFVYEQVLFQVDTWLHQDCIARGGLNDGLPDGMQETFWSNIPGPAEPEQRQGRKKRYLYKSFHVRACPLQSCRHWVRLCSL